MENVRIHFIKRARGVKKLFFCLGLSVVTFLILTFFNLSLSNRIILSWDIFCVSMVSLSWMLFFLTSNEDISTVVEKQDEGLKTIFAIVLIAVCFSLFGALILLTDRSETTLSQIQHAFVSLSPVLLSWVLLHTIFAIRYAHLFYDKRLEDAGGLEFPTKVRPDYVDFAYFSFVIGMTFQVSDILVRSGIIRRYVLMHSLISFVYNTVIVALTINTIAGLGH